MAGTRIIYVYRRRGQHFQTAEEHLQNTERLAQITKRGRVNDCPYIAAGGVLWVAEIASIHLARWCVRGERFLCLARLIAWSPFPSVVLPHCQLF